MPADADKPAVLKLVSDPLVAAQLEKLRIALTRQISRHGWCLLATALQAACEHGASHQRANARAAALWRWRAQRLRQLAMQEQPTSAERTQDEANRKSSIVNHKSA